MMIKKGLIIIAALTVLGSIYVFLGGIDDVVVVKKKSEGYEIVGKHYEGRYRSEELEQTYFEVKEKLEKGQLEGDLVVLNYVLGGDSLENGFIRQFIGVDLQTSNQTIPDGFRLQSINNKMSIAAIISAHNLVMPSPSTIDTKIGKFAKANNLELVNYTIERYVSDRELIIEVPVVEK
ncbi:MAG: hypothetical protein OEX22_02010 [Cyclobacteriaceae bacterium]|nr:hypothetical protein [Cyclobacteriaceae bacterium]